MKTSYGVEIGPLGTFTLRVVEPVLSDGELVGYIEMGKEIEDALVLLEEKYSQNIAVVLKKEELERNSWEEGMKMLERDYDWNQLESNVFIYSSFDKLSKEVLTWIDLKEEDYDRKINIENFSFDKKEWRTFSFPFFDASSKEVGRFIAMIDLTDYMVYFQRIILLGTVFGLIIFLIMVIFIYIILRNTDESILKQQKVIRENIKRYNELALQSKTFIWEVDKDAKYTYVSENVKDVIGYTSKELINKKRSLIYILKKI